ncbi:T9SS type A sorting domain-containing protein [candidate division KSB1 bacterium]|nr:T9SS type A sorting domain-containing protein [candidate division KSB1 bacterium]
MKLDLKKPFFVILVCLTMLTWMDAHSQPQSIYHAKNTVYEVARAPLNENIRSTAQKILATPSGASFDFNDGTLQDWMIIGPIDEFGNGPFFSNFTTNWADAVSYPTAGLNDLPGDQNGSFQIGTVTGHGINNPTATWWALYYVSPDLGPSSTWQNADGFSIKLLNYMEKIAPPPGDHLTLYVNMHVTILDHAINQNRYFRSYEYAEPIQNWFVDAKWIHLDFDWSTAISNLTNFTIQEVYISIWGSMSDYFEGGVYLDEIVPFTKLPNNPVLSVQPTSFDESVAAGTIVSVPLNISNKGTADLTYTLKASSAAGLHKTAVPEFETIKITNALSGCPLLNEVMYPDKTLLTSNSSTMFPPQNINNKLNILVTGWGKLDPGQGLNELILHLESLGHTVTKSKTFPAAVDNYDIMILVGGGGADEDIPEAVVDNFVGNGKGLILFEGVLESGDFKTSALSCPVQQLEGWSSFSNATIVDVTNPLCTGLVNPISLEGWGTKPTLKPGAKIALNWSNGNVMAATYVYGSGKVVYFNNLNAWYGYVYWKGDLANGKKLMENALNYCATEEVPWLSFSEKSGTLAPGLSKEVSVNFNAAGLAPAKYTAYITIKSNDLITGILELPVMMRVTPAGTPALSVFPTTLNFENIATAMSFQISNSGSGTLTWNITESPDTPWIITIAPSGGSGDATIIVTVDRTALPGMSGSSTIVVNSNGGTQNIDVTIAKEVSLPSHWRYDPNTGNSATVVLPTSANPNIEGVPLVNGDYIGAFTPARKCCGWKLWQGANLSLTIWGDNDQTIEIDGFKAGERISYAIYRASEAKEWSYVQVAYQQGSGLYSSNAYMVLNKFEVLKTTEMPLDLKAGWNMFSLNIYPTDPNIDVVLGPIKNKLLLTKNSAGQTYIPAYSINDIQTIRYDEGYQAYLKEGEAFSVQGTRVPEGTPIYLKTGWSIISYLPAGPNNIKWALISIEKNLIIAKNNNGLSYIPQYGINDIGLMQPGEGYQVHLSKPDTLFYPVGLLRKSDASEDESAVRQVTLTDHFKFAPNTGENATVVISTAIDPRYSDGNHLEGGDEIGVFTREGLCCGAIVWESKNKAITVWGDNTFTPGVDGFIAGDTLRYRVWRKRMNTEYPALVNYEPGNPVVYQPNGFSVITKFIANLTTGIITENESSIPTGFGLSQNYPNPFNPGTSIQFELSENSKVVLAIYNLQGQHIQTLLNENRNAGQHAVYWNGFDKIGKEVPAGVYFYRLETGKAVFTRKMALLR